MARACLLVLWLSLLLAPPARAALIAEEGSFGSGLADPRAVAADDAGRVYVADAGAGRVHVYESASAPAPNRFLRSIGEGTLQQPVGVAVDNRQRVYVADAGLDRVLVFDSFAEDFDARGQLADAGTAPGQLEGARALATDPSQRVFVLEDELLRVSTFRPSGRDLVFASAFGLAHKEPAVRAPTAIARDARSRLYVTSMEGDGFIRVVGRRGRFVADVGGGAVRDPEGVAVDPGDRVVVADTGKDRLVAFTPVTEGGAMLEAHHGSLRRPRALIFAPGSLLYALEAERVVRLRWDDGDRDGVTDVRDNCRDLANGEQDDTDADGLGDACDEDDDADGREDGADECPAEHGRPDADEDGCKDARTRIVAPDQGRSYRAAPPEISGRVEGAQLGVRYVQVAIGRRLDRRRPDVPGARCAWYSKGQDAFIRGTCARPRFFRASGTETWRVRLRSGLLERGHYAVAARARQLSGVLEKRLRYGQNLRVFRVR